MTAALDLSDSLPDYLRRPSPTNETFGVLRFHRLAKQWEIEGDPHVVILAKRLFPGSEGRGPGIAKFPHNKRILADLNWLMLRWPLKVEDQEAWEHAYLETLAHVRKRQEISRSSPLAKPNAVFRGELRPFQEQGLAFMLGNRRCLLADDMGLGKTPTSLAWAASLGEWPLLVVAQPHMIKHWERETSYFLSAYDVSTAQGRASLLRHTITGLTPYELPTCHIYIIHYLLLRAWREHLKEIAPHAILFDEIQELRHKQSEKYSAASDLAAQVENVVGLSGTPIYNRGGEIWNILNILEYHCLGDWDSFTREWCHGYGSDTVKHPEALGAHLRREGLLLRRMKTEVADELPEKRRVPQIIDADEGMYSRLIDSAVNLALAAERAEDTFERGRMEMEAVNDSRRITGIAKAASVCAFIAALLEAGERVLLFAHHHDVIDIYKQKLSKYHPVFITGRENPNQKDASETEFFEKRTNLCVVSLRAATGLDRLSGATCVVFGELDWSPAVHSQAEDRAGRMSKGQVEKGEKRDSILCYYLVCDEGTDAEMREALGLKVCQFVGIMGDTPEGEKDRVLAESDSRKHMKKVLEKLRNRARPEVGR